MISLYTTFIHVHPPLRVVNIKGPFLYTSRCVQCYVRVWSRLSLACSDDRKRIDVLVATPRIGHATLQQLSSAAYDLELYIVHHVSSTLSSPTIRTGFSFGFALTPATVIEPLAIEYLWLYLFVGPSLSAVRTMARDERGMRDVAARGESHLR